MLAQWENLATKKAFNFWGRCFDNFAQKKHHQKSIQQWPSAASAAANTGTPTTQRTPSNNWAHSTNTPSTVSQNPQAHYHHHRTRFHHHHHTNKMEWVKMAWVRRRYLHWIASFERLHSTQSTTYSTPIYTTLVSAWVLYVLHIMARTATFYVLTLCCFYLQMMEVNC